MADDELILSGMPRRRKGRALVPTDKLASQSATVRIEGRFQLAHKRTWGFDVILREARDRAILKKLIETWGEQVTASLVDDFFEAVRPVRHGGDPVVSKSRFSNIPDFGYHAEYLMLKRRRGNMPDARTSSNLHEVAKAMGKVK